MGCRLHAALEIGPVACAPGLPAAFIPVDDLYDPLRPGEEVGDVRGQVDEDVELAGGQWAAAEQDGGLRALGLPGQYLVRHEAAVAERPEHLIQRLQLRRVGMPDEHLVRGEV